MKLNPESIARASSRHPWRTVGIWGAILIAGMVAASTLLAPVLTTDFDFTNKPEAIRAQQLLEAKGLEQNVSPETFVLVGGPGAVNDPAFAEKVNGALSDLRGLDPSIVLTVPAGYPMSQQDPANPQIAALGALTPKSTCRKGVPTDLSTVFPQRHCDIPSRASGTINSPQRNTCGTGKPGND